MKKIITIFFIAVSYIYANSIDIVELYRTQGIKSVEQAIEKQLQNKEYWDENLKSKDTTNGYYESIRYVVICQKELKDIVLYDTQKKENLFSSSVFVGKVNGDKKVEGDLKTPIGAYDLTQRLTSVDPFYGPLALTTNYPNIYDKVNGKTGHGIWIHGLPLNQERDDFTQGCIALDNIKIEKLDNSINIENSVLVISENKLQEVSKEDISIILAGIFQWRDAWKYSVVEKYLSFYAKDFRRTNGQDLEKFSIFKRRIFSKKEDKTIVFSNINIIPYPNDQNKKIFKVSMNELYKTKKYEFDGKKELYVEIENGEFKILTES
jgi:murein L,D-transpeptidase YafK